MSLNNVSFGSVIAVSGKANKIQKVNTKLNSYARNGNVIMKDVTSHYKYASSSGSLAQAAKSGDKVEIYITGKDIEKVKSKKEGWNTIEGILSHLSVYYKSDKLSISELVQKITSM